MGKLDHVVRALEARRNPKPPEITLTDASAELTAHLDDRTNEILQSIGG